MNVVETRELGRRYGSTWALRDCTLAIPEGHLVALVGPNGAGKSTLLNLVMGLASPTNGEAFVLDGLPAGSLEALDGIGFVAQDMPLYRTYSVADMLHLTRSLNRRFDDEYARRRLDEFGIPVTQKAGKLSGGQRAQLALTLALARHPRLLVLDEPTAPLDPIARHDFMATVMTAMADDGVSVVLSSHLLAELERVADYLVLISRGAVRLDGPIDDLVGQHRVIRTQPGEMSPDWEAIGSAGAHQLVRLRSADVVLPTEREARTAGIEELAMAYLREGLVQPAAPVLNGVH